MISELNSYSVENFIPFLPESYFRLFERQFESLWPAHVLFVLLGIGACISALKGKSRITASLLALSFGMVAVSFHLRLYAELTPVGRYFGWAFLLQSGLFLIWGFLAKPRKPSRAHAVEWMGLGLAAFGLLLYPALILFSEQSWKGAEIFGLAPDPTACVALGVMLIAARPVWLLMLMPIPLLWCVVSGATLKTLEAPHAQILTVIALIATTAGITKAVWRRES